MSVSVRRGETLASAEEGQANRQRPPSAILPRFGVGPRCGVTPAGAEPGAGPDGPGAGGSMPSDPELSDSEWMSRFRSRVTERRVPISGLLELTSRCNLRCVHCYLGPQEEHWARRDEELSLEKVLQVVDEVADAGCLYLGITGGDPMVHDHFPEVYRRARERGLLVTVLCNGILVRDEILDLFRELPPSAVEVSLYGATRGTYETVTRVPGSWAKCLAGVRRLVDAGVQVVLKTVVMTLNAHEVGAMRRIADELGVEFRSDAGIFPRIGDSDAAPVALRVSPREAVDREPWDPVQVRLWNERIEAGVEPSEGLYRCAAGVSGFYIDPYGNASPCIMTSQHRYPMAERSFESLWANELVQLRSQRPGSHYGCNGCEMQAACTGCPAFNRLENGREDVKSDYVCETTRERWDRIRLESRRLSAATPAPRPGGWQPLSLARRPEAAVEAGGR